MICAPVLGQTSLVWHGFVFKYATIKLEKQIRTIDEPGFWVVVDCLSWDEESSLTTARPILFLPTIMYIDRYSWYEISLQLHQVLP